MEKFTANDVRKVLDAYAKVCDMIRDKMGFDVDEFSEDEFLNMIATELNEPSPPLD